MSKYGRTYHFPFSEGRSSDDKIQKNWQPLFEQPIVITEKLDGENTCIKTDGVFGRSHEVVNTHPWAGNMWAIWERIRYDVGDLEIFGENLYGLHSIEYERLPTHFFVFGIRQQDEWLAWEEVVFWAELFELYTVPVLEWGYFKPADAQPFIEKRMPLGSVFGGDCEGFVFRNAERFGSDVFAQNIIKYVRKNHVQTDQHWVKNWRRAMLWAEKLAAAK
jgi:RNA ligase